MKKAMIIIGAIIVGIAILIGLTKLVIETGVEEMEKAHYGEITLPNSYSVLKIHAQKGNVIKSPRNATSVGANIFEVGSDRKIIAYKREGGPSVEFGFIDTTNTAENYKPERVSEADFNARVKQLNIALIPVDKLFPETKSK